MNDELNPSGSAPAQPRGKGFRVDDFIGNLFDGLLTRVRNFVSPQRFDLLGNLIERLGYYAMALSALLVLVMVIILNVKGGSWGQMQLMIFYVLISPFLLYATVKFSRMTRGLLLSHPSSIASREILDSLALALIGLGIAVLVYSVLVVFRGPFVVLLIGLVIFMTMMFLACLPLLPQGLNVEVGGSAGAGETALNVIEFLSKAFLKAAPVMFGMISSLGLIVLCFAFFLLLRGTNQELDALNIGNDASKVMIYAMLLPALSVLGFLLMYLIIDLINAILKRDR